MYFVELFLFNLFSIILGIDFCGFLCQCKVSITIFLSFLFRRFQTSMRYLMSQCLTILVMNFKNKHEYTTNHSLCELMLISLNVIHKFSTTIPYNDVTKVEILDAIAKKKYH